MIIDYIIVFFSVYYFISILMYYIGLFRNIKYGYSDNNKPFVSVIIALKNEQNNVKKLIEDLKHQDYPLDKHEILLIDNESDDNTHPEILKYIDSLPNCYCYSTKGFQSIYNYKKEALFLGIQKAQGEIILSSDADCSLPVTWISGMASFYANDVDMVIGYSEVDPVKSMFQKFQKLDFLMLMAAARGAHNFNMPWGGSGQNISFRKSAFVKCNGYEGLEKLKGGDDSLFIEKFAKYNSGRTIFASNSATWIKTKPVNTVSALLRQRFRWASEANFARNININVYFVSLATFFANAGLVYFFLYSLFDRSKLIYLVSLTVIKLFSELLFVTKATKLFKFKPLFPVFWIWFLIYPIYALCMGIMSFFGNKFEWNR